MPRINSPSTVAAKSRLGQNTPLRRADAPTDGQLLQRFIRERDASAFTTLVERLGPLVFSVALRSVRDLHAAEDVYQATFLVLARDARKIRSLTSLRPWLHGTALRIARRALIRRQRETPTLNLQPLDDAESALDALSRHAHQALVDEELQRLPDTYQAPLLLHLVEGRTCEETALLLGLSLGAVRGRIQRAKQELKLRLTRRGVELPVVLSALAVWNSTAEAALQAPLVHAAAAGGVAMAQGTPISPVCSPESVHLAFQESVMWSTSKLLATVAALLVASACGWIAQAASSENRDNRRPSSVAPRVTTLTELAAQPGQLGLEVSLFAFADAPADAPATPPATNLQYGDNQPDGRKSIASTGEMIRFRLPDPSQKLVSLRVHCSRYGTPQAPNEDAEFSIVDADNKQVIHSEGVPYSKFQRGENRWVTIRFKEPVAVPEEFWVILEFDAQQTKGVYISYDTSTGGEHSRTGLPGAKSSAVTFGGDWMVQATLSKPGGEAEPVVDTEADQASPPNATAKTADPQIVGTEPAVGSTAVDPALQSIKVTFDRDMQDGMSWTGGGPEFPPVDKTREARWVDARTCELPVMLSGASFYRVGINSTSFQNFKAVDGTPARPSAIYFTTEGAGEELQRQVRRPKIVSIAPANGAEGVSPATTELKVTFDLPMGAGFSWVGSGPHFPSTPEGQRPSWSDDHLTCTLPVKLEPNWSYKLGLNSVQHINFQSQWGVPLEPVVYQFTTAEK